MKILVTGGAGYIGSVMMPQLLNEGHEVICIDTLIHHQNSLLECCHLKAFDFIRVDVRDENVIKKLVKKVDVIIPLASFTGAPLCNKDPWGAKTVIVDAIALLLKYRNKKQPILYPNTNSGYGIGEKGKFCTEETPLRPISLYGKLKVEAEKMILDSGNALIFRLATVFGASPRMRIDLLVNDFVYRAVADRYIVIFEADAKRNYVHIRDVTAAFIFGLNNWEKMKDNIYNLGLTSANLSKRELCEKIKEHIPDFYYTVAEIGKDPDKRDYIVSNEKIEKKGFKPKFSLDDGIKELIKAYSILKLKKEEFSNYPC